jgi:hypothetical protein
MKALLFALLIATAAWADLNAVRREPNPEKRSEKALQHADAAVDAARKAYESGDMKAVEAALNDITSAIRLAKESLDNSGKNARKNPKYFKKAEQSLRRLGRRLDTLRLEFSVDERPPVEEVMRLADTTRDDILGAVLGRK